MNNFFLKGKTLILMLVTLACATACEDDDDNQPTLTMQTFMSQAAASDMFEIATGTMATTKGNRTEVKNFGTMLVTDHTLSSSQLMALATQKNVTLPTSMPQNKTDKVMRLQGLSGTAFDKEFASMQVDAHKEAIDLYERADRDINDANLQTFIDQTLPKLRMHLDMAEDVEDLTN